MSEGGGASRSTDPAAGTSQATDVSLREFIEQRFVALEERLDERRKADQAAVVVAKATADTAVQVAKETSDAALLSHNGLIKKMEDQASESSRQLQRLTDTYATKENLRTLEVLIDQRLESLDEKARAIEAAVGISSTQRLAARGVWSDLRSVVVFGFVAMAGVIGLITYLAQN